MLNKLVARGCHCTLCIKFPVITNQRIDFRAFQDARKPIKRMKPYELPKSINLSNYLVL